MKKHINRHSLIRSSAILLGAIFLLIQVGCSHFNMGNPVYGNKSNTHTPGKFVWHDLLTSDVDRAKEFYSGLFDWSFEAGKNEYYTIAMLNGTPIAGLLNIPLSDTNMYAARWVSSLSVADVDQAVTMLVNSGGIILQGPENIKDRGRIVLVRDPFGAQLTLIKTSFGDPLDAPVSVGNWLWHELWTNTPQQASAFYRQLADYDGEEEMNSYYVLKSGEQWRAGIRPLENDAFEKRWVPVIRVADVNVTAALAAQYGGKIIVAPDHPDFPDLVALLADPSGALIIIQEWSQDGSVEGN